MDNNNNKNNMYWGIALVVVLVIIGAWALLKPAKVDAPTIVEEQTESTQDTEHAMKPATGSKSTKATIPTASPISYLEAKAKYEGRRFQVDYACKVTPDTVTFKNDVDVMIDNRTSLSRVFKIDGNTITIKAWGFQIINLSSTTLPKTILVDCDNQQNVANILLQS